MQAEAAAGLRRALEDGRALSPAQACACGAALLQASATEEGEVRTRCKATLYAMIQGSDSAL